MGERAPALGAAAHHAPRTTLRLPERHANTSPWACALSRRNAHHHRSSYLAVSSRGNFYLTYRPGDEFWIPHNRGSSRRITSMGFIQSRLEDGLWMSTAGGEISRTTPSTRVDTQIIDIPFDRLQIKSGGYGILDVVFIPNSNQAWAVGGGGTIFGSVDGGRTWQKDKSADDLPTNLYKIKFFGDKGYILGSNGVLLSNV